MQILNSFCTETNDKHFSLNLILREFHYNPVKCFFFNCLNVLFFANHIFIIIVISFGNYIRADASCVFVGENPNIIPFRF